LAHFYFFAGKNKNEPKMGLKMKRKMATMNNPNGYIGHNTSQSWPARAFPAHKCTE
jgi:hypothetical protein